VLELRDRLGTGTTYGKETRRIRRIRVAETVPKSLIENEVDLNGALDALRSAVTEALANSGAVEIS